MTDAIKFTAIRKDHGWMSNMSPYSLKFAGEIWPTSEHAFQACRFDRHHPIRKEIRATSNPMSAKTIAKNRVDEMTIRPWSREDVDLMSQVVHSKLTYNPDLIDALVKTGIAFIYEDTTFRKSYQDLFWGAIYSDDEWIGMNHLGEILMTHREYFQYLMNFNYFD